MIVTGYSIAVFGVFHAPCRRTVLLRAKYHIIYIIDEKKTFVCISVPI